MLSNYGDTINFGRYISIIENRVDGCLGNHAFYIVQIMFDDKSILHYMDDEQFDCHEKNCPGVQGRLNKHPCYWVL